MVLLLHTLISVQHYYVIISGLVCDNVLSTFEFNAV